MIKTKADFEERGLSIQPELTEEDEEYIRWLVERFGLRVIKDLLATPKADNG